ncbi:hypothetical protein D9758_004115 [Tetrapyrgos nigripes]|uniref:Protein kinase domain-containing protein n=1 Tax=Tetrapyrgos nigripes TaxID=182062 RepID=A0A8H5LVM3_9AGAR|nr:hypothetical protein D9758_004115 [Tetrapyrgos nigripes]
MTGECVASVNEGLFSAGEDVIVYLSDVEGFRSEDIVLSIQQAACRFRDSPNQFQSFLAGFPTTDFRVVCSYDRPGDYETDIIDLIIIITSSGDGQIFAPQSESIEKDFLHTTSELRALISSSGELNGFGLLTRRWAFGISELLQLEVSNAESSESYRRKCLKYLRELSRQHNVLPPSFLLHDLVKVGDYPVWGGGFADIYKGRNNSEVVCVKVLRLFTSSSVRTQLFKEFSNEAIVWKQLDHPNVLPFLGVNTVLFSPSFCLVSPWMENGNVLNFIDNNPDHDRLGMLLEIAQGLRYLHNLNPQVIHGDIRGANVMVNSAKTCCLADFGLALVTESQSFATTSSGIHGSVRWMAPEIIEPSRMIGKEKIPSSRDVYAFGCTMLEIFTGKPPYAEIRMEISVITEILKGNRPPRPVQSAALISDDLWDLIEDCWVDHPEYRPTASRIVQALAIRSRSQSRPASRTAHLPDEESDPAFLLAPLVEEQPRASCGTLSRRTSWVSKDSLSTTSSVSCLSLSHYPPPENWEPELIQTANTSVHMASSPDQDCTLEPDVLKPTESWVEGDHTLYDSPESVDDHLDEDQNARPLPASHNNDLMYGFSHGFDEPLLSYVSLRSLESPGALPQQILLSYRSHKPFHIQAPGWSQLLHLLKGHPETNVEVDVPGGMLIHSEFKLRVVCQFIKPALARHWRFVIWLTVDYPLPTMRAHDIEEEFGVEQLPRSYNFSNSVLPSMLRESNKNVSMHYTIPQTQDLPYPSLPLSLPGLAIYLEAAMDQSLSGLKRTRRSWRRSNGVELLARMVDCCEDGEPYYLPEWGKMFFRKLQRAFSMPWRGRTTRDAVVIR